MSEPSFKYDVAFSFLQADEDLAIKVARSLSSRLASFVYSERQAELAGQDGEQTFNDVFARDARVVVVLYREQWGTTKWTRIEQTAIRNRGFNSGYSFVLFVVFDPNSQVPSWLPVNQIWYDYHRFGIGGISATIENKLSSLGINTKEITLEESAAGINAEISFSRRRKQFLESEEGVAAAEGQVDLVYQKLAEAADKITVANPELKSQVNISPTGTEVKSTGFLLQISWTCRHVNSLDTSVLSVDLSEIERDPMSFPRQYQQREGHEFDFDVSLSNDFGWRMRSSQDRLLSSQEVAEFALKTLFEAIRSFRLEGQ